RVSGATGRPAPATLKVSATLRAGFRASGTLTIIGSDAVAKATRAGQVVEAKLRAIGAMPQHFHAETIGSGNQTVLRISAADDRRETIERFTRQIVPLVTSGPQGTTGYFDGRPAAREVFQYWPCLIDRTLVKPVVEVMPV